MTTEEIVAMEVEAPITKKEKKEKKKKSKKLAEVEEPCLKRKAEEEHEDAPAKKKKKKSKKTEEAAEEEPVAMEEVAAEEPEKKKKKKKSKKVEEEPVKEEAKEDEASAETKADEEDKAEEEPKEEEAAAPEEKNESLTVVIGGLPWSADEETVKKDFSECGEITSFRYLYDKETQRPKGTAFADYATEEGVKKALEFNETEYGGRNIYVRRANDESHKGKGKKGKGKKGDGKKGKGAPRTPGEKPEGCKSVVVKNFAYSATEDDLWKVFEPCGAIDRLKLLTDRETGESKGIAFIDFSEEAGVDEAIKKCNEDMGGRAIFVDYSGGKGEGKKGDGKKGGKKGDGKKGKGKKGKGKAPSAAATANRGSIVEATGTAKSFDSDSD